MYTVLATCTRRMGQTALMNTDASKRDFKACCIATYTWETPGRESQRLSTDNT
ncbi:hypothetical protein DPMN_091768 [Dreissena polymorpha]|uniref:Uncharacterized protein n=1 Tax=Dreissena polymorpha TaxID=45954 RepID=A0A9D4L144_DREPO|nr:hypothetical protein DPMN_091768 [Dreissena polymorpha]